MDLANVTQLARSQGPIFWVATAAIALGATLLVVALIQQLRVVFAARRPLRDVPVAAPPVDEDPDIYEQSPSAAAIAPRSTAGAGTIAEDAGDTSLALLLRRLQSAGDRLEEVAGDLRGEFPVAEESGLKEGLQDVEYVFRASGP